MRERMHRLAAVVFDFDGVLAETEPLHYAAFQDVLAPLGLGLSWAQYAETYLSFNDRDVFQKRFHLARRALSEEDAGDLIEAKGRAFRKRLESDGDVLRPGVVELVRCLSGRVPLGICSCALPGDIEPILRRARLMSAFDVIVTAREAPASKPDPSGYRLTLERLAHLFPSRSISGGRSVAVEDSPGGIAAARAAGLRVLAVEGSYPADALQEADRIVSTLENISFSDFLDLIDSNEATSIHQRSQRSILGENRKGP